MFCKNFQAILTAPDDADLLVTRTRCKMWSCNYCSNINKKQWRVRIIRATDELGAEWAFATLTAHGRAKDGPDSLNNLQNGWKRLSARMRRHFGRFHYVRIYERHKDGRWHWHMLVNFHFDDLKQRRQKDGKSVWYSPWLKKAATACGMGWYTHAENMRSVKGAAVYITKYMTKDLQELPKGIRRVQTSQGFPKLEDEKEYEWSLRSGIYARDLEKQERIGGDVIDIQTRDALSYDDFETSYIWPPEFYVKPWNGS